MHFQLRLENRSPMISQLSITLSIVDLTVFVLQSIGIGYNVEVLSIYTKAVRFVKISYGFYDRRLTQWAVRRIIHRPIKYDIRRCRDTSTFESQAMELRATHYYDRSRRSRCSRSGRSIIRRTATIASLLNHRAVSPFFFHNYRSDSSRVED